VAERMADLTRVLTMPTEASGVVVGAVAHAEIAVVSPFGSGDGVVARAVEHMVLISAGVDPYGLISCEAGHRADPEGYSNALRHYRDEGALGVRAWLQHCASALARGAASAGKGG
jgi:Fic family protein